MIESQDKSMKENQRNELDKWKNINFLLHEWPDFFEIRLNFNKNKQSSIG